MTSDQFPLRKIFLAAIKVPFQQYKQLIRLGWPFIAFLFAFSFYSNEFDSIILNIIYGIINTFLGLIALVACHRVFILPEGSVKHLSTFRWSSTEINFLFNMLYQLA